MYLYKVYDVLGRDRFLKILEVYSMGLWARCLLCTYCDRIYMVACVGGYYRISFEGYSGVA